jgi:hypothetical protein
MTALTASRFLLPDVGHRPAKGKAVRWLRRADGPDRNRL